MAGTFFALKGGEGAVACRVGFGILCLEDHWAIFRGGSSRARGALGCPVGTPPARGTASVNASERSVAATVFQSQ